MNSSIYLKFQFNIPKAQNLFLGMTTQAHGNMRLASIKNDPEAQLNRQAFFKSFFPNYQTLGAVIAHSPQVFPINTIPKEPPVCDGLITQEQDLLLFLTVADCVPVFLYTPAGAFGLIHAGWRGIANGIITNACKILYQAFSVALKDIYFVLGPSICQAHYEVGEDLFEIFKNHPKAFKSIKHTRYLDLKTLIQEELKGLGVLSSQIQNIPLCTYETAELYSHRKQGVFPPKTQMVFIGKYL